MATVSDYGDDGPTGEYVEVKHPGETGPETMLVRKDRAGQYEPVDTPEPTSGAKELADKEGADLSEVEGSGKDGRVTKADVKSHLSQ